MIKAILPAVLLWTLSTFSFAATETYSFKTATNQTVTIGDSIHQLMDRTGQSPSSMKSTSWQEGDQTHQALEYHYHIGENVYAVTVVNNLVRKIEYKKDI